MKILRVIFVIAVLCAPFYAQQVNQDIVPASPGLYLGHTNQRWNGYFNNADIYNLTINGSPIGTGGIGLPQISIPNGTNCTTLNGLVEFDGNGQAQTASLSSTKVIGVAVSGAGCSGNVLVQYAAIVNCTTDGSTLINDRIAASNSIPGDCMDIGPISIPGIQTVGLVTAVSSGAGQLTSFDLFTGDTISPSSSSGSGVVSVSPCVGPFGYAATAAAIVSWDCNTSLDGSGNAGFKKVTVTGSGAGKIDFGSSTTPGNPAGGFFRLYADSGTGLLTCLTSTGASCLSAGAAFSAITSGANTAAVMQVSTGASLAPLSIGQVAGNSIWVVPANATSIPNAPTLTVANVGGSLTQNTYFFRLTYVGLGTIVPSAESRAWLNPTNCASNTTCQITVNMPTSCQTGNLPTGATGCTVWDVLGSQSAVNTERQQAVSSNCVNITTATCVVNVTAAGSLIPSPPQTTGVAPSPFANIAQPDFIVPSIFAQKGDGNFYPMGGMDYSALNVLTGSSISNGQCPATGCQAGTFTWTDRFFINDANGGPISNSLFSVHHLAGQTTATGTLSGGVAPDDRAATFQEVDAATSSPFFGQSLTQYNERIITNNAFTCSPINGGSAVGESCAAAGRFVLADNRPAPTVSMGGVPVGVAGVASNQTPNGTSIGSCGNLGTPCIAGVAGGAFQQINNQNGQGGFWVGGWFQSAAASGNTNGSGAGVFTNITHSFASANYGFAVAGNSATNGDFNIISYTSTANTGRNYFAGPTDFQSPFFGTTLPSQLATPAAGFTASNNNCAGATNWGYKLVPRDIAGGWAPATTAATTSSTSCATLDATHTVTITVNTGGTGLNASEVYGRHDFDVYRTTAGGTPSTTGYIGNVLCNLSGCSFIDTGLAVTIPPNDDPATPPAYNTSGRIAGYTIGTVTNCAAVGTAASPSVASCVAAAAGSFSCATNAVNTCTVNTTAVTGSSQIFISQREDAATGTRLGVTCNVTPSVVIADENITAVVAGTSFSFGLTQPVTSPDCFSYFIVN